MSDRVCWCHVSDYPQDACSHAVDENPATQRKDPGGNLPFPLDNHLSWMSPVPRATRRRIGDRAPSRCRRHRPWRLRGRDGGQSPCAQAAMEPRADLGRFGTTEAHLMRPLPRLSRAASPRAQGNGRMGASRRLRPASFGLGDRDPLRCSGYGHWPTRSAQWVPVPEGAHVSCTCLSNSANLKGFDTMPSR